ncbi:MAG: cobalamin-binding protein [Desulfobacterales bacterium]|nr:cobalamin-binding protein [Desulfobacterales bacterium]
MKNFFLTVIFIFLICIPDNLLASREFIDQAGRKVIVPDKPERVIALAPSITEIIFAIGEQHRLKGVTKFSDYPSDAARLPKVGSYVQLDIERIIALKPDLCIGIKDGNPIETVTRLESFKIPVYAVDPKNLQGVLDTVNDISILLNAEEKGSHIVNDMKSRINAVKKLSNTVSYRPKVFFQIGVSPIVSIGTDSFLHELIITAGGQNVSEGKIPYPRFTVEQIIALEPDIIIITSMERGGLFEKAKEEWSYWKSIPAVKNNKIYVVDSNLFDRPTPRVLSGIELLFSIIHPELKLIEN